MSEDLNWIGDSGPMILLAEAEAAGWLGSWREVSDDDDEDLVEVIDGRTLTRDELDDDELRSDYARVCAALEASGVAAIVPFEGGTALALETSGHQAAFVLAGEDLLVAKWIAAPSVEHADLALDSVPDDLDWEEAGLLFELPSRGVRIIPAAARANDPSEVAASWALEPGRYALATASFEPDDETFFELFRLRRV